MQLLPNERLLHECGCDFTNTTTEVINFENSLCPRCKGLIRIHEILGRQPIPIEYTKWVLTPPHGMTFKNEFGSEVSIQFEVGKEEELFQSLQLQLNQLIQKALSERNKTQILAKNNVANSRVSILAQGEQQATKLITDILNNEKPL